MSLSFNKVKTAVGVVLKAGHVPLIIGLQGIGKSDLVREWAREQDCEFEEITCSLLQEGDMAMPYMTEGVDSSEKDVLYAINKIITGLVKRCEVSGKDGILFLDEFNRPSANVQSELMNLVLQRRIVSYKLPDCIKLVLAMNPSSEMVGYEQSDYSVSFSDAAIMGRVLKLDMAPVLSEWLSYGKRKFEGTDRLLVHPAVSDYLSQNPKEFVTPEVSGEVNNTPRGWSRVSDVCYSYEDMGMKDKQLFYELMKGTLREKTAAVFKDFYAQRKPTVNYLKLAKSVLTAKSIGDWDNSLFSMNDAELATLFNSMLEYCNSFGAGVDHMRNMVEFIKAASNELIYAWAGILESKYPSIYEKVIEDVDCANKILSILNSVQGRKAGGFVGK